MNSIYATIRARIWGTRNYWSAAQTGGPEQPNCECSVELEIQGNSRNGYHLVMSPSGFFVADSWHPTKQDALDTAYEIFGVEKSAWSEDRLTGNGI